MINEYIQTRLQGIQTVLMGVHKTSSPMSATTSGAEREAIINHFLSAVFPNQFRFGTGDVTDRNGNKSGQLDVVIENAGCPSLPSIPAGSRLYLAEGVAAVIEVKSNIAVQWEQAERTAKNLSPIERSYNLGLTMGKPTPKDVPLFIISYAGWSEIETLKKHVADVPNIDGILVIEHGLFVSSSRFQGIVANGPLAMWGLIICLNQAISSLKAYSFNPIIYAQ